MPKTIADGRILLTALTVKPKDPGKPTVAELKAGKKISGRILKSDYALGAGGSQTITETELCNRGEGQAFGLSTYSGNLSVFRYFDDMGKAAVADDFAWEMMKEKGTQIWLAEREGPVESKEWEDGDEVSIYEVTTDDPQKPQDRFAGYIKRTIPLAVGAAWENVKAVAG